MFKAGDKVEILVGGEWEGIYVVIAGVKARTPDHLVLSGPHGLFELYNDAPYNVRLIKGESNA